MKIKLVKNDLCNSVGKHLSRIAWENSRSLNDETPLEDILKIDAPINDFPSFVLQIESSIMVREIITSMNDHVMWARGSRVDDITQFETEAFTTNEKIWHEIEGLRNSMFYAKSNGVRQDEYRLLAPVISMTSYTIRVSLRSMIKLYHYFIKLSNYLSGTSAEIFKGAATEFIAFLSLVPLLDKDVAGIVAAYKTVDIVPALQPEDSGNGMVGDFIVITVNVPFSLRTHLIRHNSLHIKDNLIEFFNDENIHKKTLNDKMNVQICASTDFWVRVLKERSCWMSHYKMWKQIINELEGLITQNETFLPCQGDGTSCPFAGDAVQRLEGNDPNPPCPIHTYSNNISITSQQKTNVEHMLNEDERPNFWHNWIESLEVEK